VIVQVVSDVICPWCFIGKRRLAKAIASLANRQEHRVGVDWLPFQLNPQMPRAGMDRRAYRTAKFGSWERSQSLETRVIAAGADEGIAFAFDRIERTPNTFDAHRLIWLAGREGVQDAVVEGLFRSYFIDAKDVGDRRVLIGIADEVGMDTSRLLEFLDGDAGVDDVRQLEEQARRMGVDAVPTFVVGDKVVAAGAQPADVLAGALKVP
jgi:predicted DsbA family dithiol-disulfide isomerase